MKRGILKKIMMFLAVNLLIAVINPINGQAATLAEKYKSGIRVGFISFKTLNSLNFTLTGDYYISGTPVLLPANNYNLSFNGSIFTLKRGTETVYTSSSNPTIAPLKFGSYIEFYKDTTQYISRFSGSMSFKKNPNAPSYFIPVNNLNFNDYLLGVVPYEASDSWPLNALKAQAVAARTFAMHQMTGGTLYDVGDTTAYQVYRKYYSSTPNSKQAIAETNGQVLTYNGAAIGAFFSSSNAGWTELPQYSPSYGGTLPYYTKIQKDDYDHQYRYTYTINNLSNGNKDILYRLQNNLAYLTLNIQSINSISFTQSSFEANIVNVTINYTNTLAESKTLVFQKYSSGSGYDADDGKIDISHLNMYDFRDLMGIKSSWFTCEKSGSSYILTSRYGHGVGMSQWGAYWRAKAGISYVNILNFYYRNIDTVKLENVNTAVPILSYDTRLGGSTRFDTANLIAQKVNSGMINDVLVATGANFPDAIAAAPLAGKLGTPILLVDSKPDSANSKGALDYIAGHLNKSGNIYIVGGTGAVPDTFKSKFQSMGFNNIIRVSGTGRIETSIALANHIGAGNKTVILTSAGDFPDAVSISSIAALYKWPILLTNKTGLSDAVKNYLAANKPTKIYIIGGTGVISDTVADQVKSITGYEPVRYGGSNRYSTSQIIASSFIQNPEEIVFSTGKNFPDALTSSIYAARNFGPVMLIDENSTSSAYAYVKSIGANEAESSFSVVGGTGAVSSSMVDYLKTIK